MPVEGSPSAELIAEGTMSQRCLSLLCHKHHSKEHKLFIASIMFWLTTGLAIILDLIWIELYKFQIISIIFRDKPSSKIILCEVPCILYFQYGGHKLQNLLLYAQSFIHFELEMLYCKNT